MAGNSDQNFDIIVVGAGMFGSSAAKYLSKMSPSARVALIGPTEPEDRADTDVSQTFIYLFLILFTRPNIANSSNVVLLTESTVPSC